MRYCEAPNCSFSRRTNCATGIVTQRHHAITQFIEMPVNSIVQREYKEESRQLAMKLIKTVIPLLLTIAVSFKASHFIKTWKRYYKTNLYLIFSILPKCCCNSTTCLLIIRRMKAHCTQYTSLRRGSSDLVRLHDLCL